MPRIHRLITAALLACLAGTAMATTPDETDEAKFIRLTRHLERFPLDPDAAPMRAWLLDWATRTPDMVVVVCDVLGPGLQPESYYGGLLFMQMLYGNAAWQIAHPESRGEALAPQVAGVRSALKAYAEMSTAREEARLARFDALLADDRQGVLEATLAPRVAEHCQSTGSTDEDAGT